MANIRSRNSSNSTGFLIYSIIGLAFMAIGYLVFVANMKSENNSDGDKPTPMQTLTEKFNLEKIEAPAELNKIQPGSYRIDIPGKGGEVNKCIANVTYSRFSEYHNVELVCGIK